MTRFKRSQKKQKSDLPECTSQGTESACLPTNLHPTIQHAPQPFQPVYSASHPTPMDQDMPYPGPTVWPELKPSRLELWCFIVVILMVGWLKNPELVVDSISTSLALQLWVLMITLGFNAAIRFTKIPILCHLFYFKYSSLTLRISCHAIVVTVVFTVAVIATKDHYPRLFSAKPEVIHETSKLAYFLAATIFLMKIESILHGTLLQTIVLTFKMWKANWQKEAIHAEELIKAYDDQSSQDEIEQFGSHTTSPLPVVI
ncbi:hypothetical protein BC332_30752 [Capsicum chinense]|nr:hypothetical protein BC332_30752 [Capsicum chinense]